jgi:hypothetical protein
MDSLLSLPPTLAEKLITSEYSSVWLVPATFFYFGYVTLGSISPSLHEHLFTGDIDKPVIENLRNGQIVTIPKVTYKEFYFPAYLRYWNTYRVHTLGAGIWLLTSFYNLRNQPQLGKLANGKVGYPRSTLHRASGYVYVVSGFLKAVTVPLMAYNSHSLANWIRVPLAAIGVWDVATLGVATYYIAAKRNIQLHRQWMIRNFSAGSGSLWVRVFGAVWAACDLSFMRTPEMFGQMNGYALLGGFYYGIFFGEWWLAKNNKQRRRNLEKIMALLCLWVAVMGKRMYRTRAAKKANGKEVHMFGCPAMAA